MVGPQSGLRAVTIEDNHDRAAKQDEICQAANEVDTGDGVVIVGFASADTNRLVFVDNTGTSRTYPYVAVLQINFGTNLQNDASAIYRVFFTSVPSGDFGTSNAIIVNDNANSPMSGNVSAQAFVQRTFNYDGNVQGGRTAGQDAPITAVALGLSTAQYVLATGTIQRSIANAITLTAALERNYANPEPDLGQA